MFFWIHMGFIYFSYPAFPLSFLELLVEMTKPPEHKLFHYYLLISRFKETLSLLVERSPFSLCNLLYCMTLQSVLISHQVYLR